MMLEFEPLQSVPLTEEYYGFGRSVEVSKRWNAELRLKIYAREKQRGSLNQNHAA